ncbi:hypothetical protein DL96DRAFT_1811486 [Flagelloscypha sp. PMI_526]|nr:hypothetical protein DL96DRAFT_1811486 [Flagelloscypha sp. PMI_526]
MSNEAQHCVFCRRQFSQYTCPKCNAPYCSLLCFKSNEHSSCSESFYKNELASDIKSSAHANHEERLRMLEILRRFEDDNANQDLEDNSDNDSEDDLEARLAKLDIENAPSEALWELLTPEERARFLKAVDDPQSDLAQTLLAAQQKIPWWDGNDSLSIAKLSVADDENMPKLMSIPAELMSASLTSTHPLPVWNLIAILLAYVHAIRHLGLVSFSSSPSDAIDARHHLRRLAPFLTDRKSKLIMSSLDETITDLWSRLDSHEGSPSLFSSLMSDVTRLVTPLPPVIAPVSDGPPMHRHTPLILALSDIESIFGTTKVQDIATSRKIAYYVMHVKRAPSDILASIVKELKIREHAFREELTNTNEIVREGVILTKG